MLIYQWCLIDKFGNYLCSHNLQFGFKKHSGCANALYTVQQVVNYYNERGSTIYMAALDASKAFDRINHSTLINKLVSRNMPQCVTDVIVNWYSKLHAAVRWNGILSHEFNLHCGVRQGGVLSPILFNLYMNDLIDQLDKGKFGCCLNDVYVGCTMYADDILLLSASVVCLQSMLDRCCEYGKLHDIVFNCKKTVCMKVGSKWSCDISTMLLNGVSLEWVDSFKYLGIMLMNGRNLHIDCNYIKRKFYTATNSVLSKCKFAEEPLKLALVKATCLPILLYCLGALCLPQHRVRQLGVCWNDCFRKIFHYNRWDSVKELQYFCGELSFEYLYDLNKWNFLSNMRSSSTESSVMLQCDILIDELVTTIVYPGHLRSWSMRQFFRIGPRIDSHKGDFF